MRIFKDKQIYDRVENLFHENVANKEQILKLQEQVEQLEKDNIAIIEAGEVAAKTLFQFIPSTKTGIEELWVAISKLVDLMTQDELRRNQKFPM